MCRSSVSAKSPGSSASDGGNGSVWSDPENDIVAGVCNVDTAEMVWGDCYVDIAIRIHCDIGGEI